MKDENAQHLLAKVMGWQDQDVVLDKVPVLRLLADYKYDGYQRFGPGKRFVESLALWLNQFDMPDRAAALDFVLERLVYVSDNELSHLVQHAYPDVIVQERIRLVAEEKGIPTYRVGEIGRDPRFEELQLKSLYLGLSDGARTNELRRFSSGEISNEQIWQAYELGEAKAEDMLEALGKALTKEPEIAPPGNEDIWRLYDAGEKAAAESLIDLLRVKPVPVASQPLPKFTLVWLMDDFSGSGNTYIRFDSKKSKFKGKIKKIYERLHEGDLIDTSHYEVFLLLYVATRQAIDHIEYWSERFTSENNYKPLQVRVLCIIEPEVGLTHGVPPSLQAILNNPRYYDPLAFDEHIEVGGTTTAQMGFAGCALPVVLSHNTPNNSVYMLWGSEAHGFPGLFPRVSRHKEF
ncbi:phosphoribosyltransferase-like protein [Rhizobacter fulvus]